MLTAPAPGPHEATPPAVIGRASAPQRSPITIGPLRCRHGDAHGSHHGLGRPRRSARDRPPEGGDGRWWRALLRRQPALFAPVESLHHTCRTRGLRRGYQLTYSVGWELDERERAAIAVVPETAWQVAIDPEARSGNAAPAKRAAIPAAVTLPAGWRKPTSSSQPAFCAPMSAMTSCPDGGMSDVSPWEGSEPVRKRGTPASSPATSRSTPPG